MKKKIKKIQKKMNSNSSIISMSAPNIQQLQQLTDQAYTNPNSGARVPFYDFVQCQAMLSSCNSVYCLVC